MATAGCDNYWLDMLKDPKIPGSREMIEAIPPYLVSETGPEQMLRMDADTPRALSVSVTNAAAIAEQGGLLTFQWYQGSTIIDGDGFPPVYPAE